MISKKLSIHNLSLQGISGIIFGLLFLLFIFGLKYILESYTSGTEGFSLLPISFFQIIAIVYIFIAIILLYLTVTIINKRRRRKIGLKGWSSNSKTIRILFLGFIIINGLAFAYFMNIGALQMIIPTCLILYGITAMLSHSKTNGNTKILGVLFMINGLLAYFYPSYSFILMFIGFGGYHILYGIFYTEN